VRAELDAQVSPLAREGSILTWSGAENAGLNFCVCKGPGLSEISYTSPGSEQSVTSA
jgi:hypothetical protein